MPEADKNYTEVLKALIEIEEALYKEWTEGKFEAKHPMFDYDGPYPPSATDKVKMFDRSKLEDRFVKEMGDNGVELVDALSIHAQADFIASLEKAFRARHRGRVAHLSYGVSRFWGHTHPDGFLRVAMQRLPVLENS